MEPMVRVWALMSLGSMVAFAQSAISAKSGMIHYLEGRVFVGDQALESKFGSFPELKENATLRTEDGRAELLLNPGVFLRVSENSSLRMISSRLVDTRLEFLSGSAVVEAEDLLKDNAITLVYKDYAVSLLKKGLYRFNSEPAELRVYDGEARVERSGVSVLVKDGRQLAFDGQMAVGKFDKHQSDELNRWSRRRSEYLAMANVPMAKSLHDRGYIFNQRGWLWNPYFGMFTYMPFRGACYSPYGYRFWTPNDVRQVYYPRPESPSYNSSLGYVTMPSTYSGHSGTLAATPSSAHTSSTSAAAAASAPISRDSGHASGRAR